ncbi:MAG: hypothetical protein JJ850_04820 [Kordiimonadaceae bacterium]|nr:hypothetical protein [Kordiimonadaceae bacterium]MBO6568358.1 hypothetical protein [Kordiimonadaceae bacterium]MBO6963913.1 hypothetical protein [Kordiimonadaceae bacterium]
MSEQAYGVIWLFAVFWGSIATGLIYFRDENKKRFTLLTAMRFLALSAGIYFIRDEYLAPAEINREFLLLIDIASGIFFLVGLCMLRPLALQWRHERDKMKKTNQEKTWN